jgi:hypothetical protein
MKSPACNDPSGPAATTTALTQLRAAEMLRLKTNAGDRLTPKAVVNEARNPKNVLHPCFEWDNRKAGEEYRLWQARQLIRVFVTVLDEAPQAGPVNVFVSLTTDRKEPDGGYRMTVDVLKHVDQRAQLLEDAKREFVHWKTKYRLLHELAGIFAAAEKVWPA